MLSDQLLHPLLIIGPCPCAPHTYCSVSQPARMCCMHGAATYLELQMTIVTECEPRSFSNNQIIPEQLQASKLALIIATGSVHLAIANRSSLGLASHSRIHDSCLKTWCGMRRCRCHQSFLPDACGKRLPVCLISIAAKNSDCNCHFSRCN